VENPDATLTAVFVSNFAGVYRIGARGKVRSNAVRAAVEVYIAQAKTGKLPDALPKDLPGDMFSGKPFMYEKTAEGFLLRCRAKDLSKDMIHEYEFKVAK